MKKTNFNLRKCIICQKKLPKNALIKLTVVDNQIQVNNAYVYNTIGKGHYISKDLNWDDDAIIFRLSKKLHCNVNNIVIDKIKILSKGEN